MRRTLSTVVAGNEDVDKTRESELTDVSPELLGSTALNDCWYIAGTVASAVFFFYQRKRKKKTNTQSFIRSR